MMNIVIRKRLDWVTLIVITVIFVPVTSALEMLIKMEDDSGHQETYNITTDLQTLLKETPPFQVPKKEMEKMFKAKVRPRRAVPGEDELPFTRKLPKCEEYMSNYKEMTGGNPIHLMYSVDLYEDLRLTCHYCGDSEQYGETIEWKMLGREKFSRDNTYKYKIRRVGLDMHDDDSMNRVYIDDEFNLHIKNVTEKDTGTYFCHDMKTKDPAVSQWLDLSKLKNFFYTNDRFRMFFHVEVIFPAQVKLRLVDPLGLKYMKPLGESINSGPDSDNLVHYTSWGEWTDCSVCGQDGERKRRGTCMAKLKDGATVTHNAEHIFYILKEYKPGLPCTSSLFANWTRFNFRERPDEMEINSCFEECGEKLAHAKFEKVNLQKIQFKGLRKVVPESSPKVIEGERIDLTCPRSTIDSLVYWMNGSNYMTTIKLRETTSGRVDIDAYNVFTIFSAVPSDQTFYTCWFNGRRQMVFNLKVLPPPGMPPWVQHLIYVLYGLTVDFWIFVVMVAIRHKHRRVQKSHRKTKNKEAFAAIDEDESDDTDIDDVTDDDLQIPAYQEIER